MLSIACSGPQSGSGSSDEAGSGETGEPACSFGCDNCSEPLWKCECGQPDPWNWTGAIWGCPACSATAPVTWCKDTIFDKYRVWQQPCYIGPSDEGVDETGAGVCGSWDPDAEVAVILRVYHLDQTFVDALVANPAPLTQCDDTRLDEITSPIGFQIQDSDAGELLYELGLRDGDIPLTLNTMSLQSYDDAFDAFSVLYLTGGETTYQLKVRRGSKTITLNYEVR